MQGYICISENKPEILSDHNCKEDDEHHQYFSIVKPDNNKAKIFILIKK